MFNSISSLLGIPYNWLTKLLWLSLMIGIWEATIGQIQNDLVTLMNYVFNLVMFPLFPESAIIQLEQFVVLMATIKIAAWVLSEKPGSSGSRN